jgi:hypothetical protein
MWMSAFQKKGDIPIFRILENRNVPFFVVLMRGCERREIDGLVRSIRKLAMQGMS